MRAVQVTSLVWQCSRGRDVSTKCPIGTASGSAASRRDGTWTVRTSFACIRHGELGQVVGQCRSHHLRHGELLDWRFDLYRPYD